MREQFNKSNRKNGEKASDTELSAQQGIYFENKSRWKTSVCVTIFVFKYIFIAVVVVVWLCMRVYAIATHSLCTLRSVHCSSREWKHRNHIQNDGVVSKVSVFSYVSCLLCIWCKCGLVLSPIFVWGENKKPFCLTKPYESHKNRCYMSW